MRLSALGLAAAGLPVNWLRTEIKWPGLRLGRVLNATAAIYERPSFDSLKVKTFWRDQLIDLVGTTIGDGIPEHNRVWHEVDKLGFVHSSSIQPVGNFPNEPQMVIPESGMLMEVTIPYADANRKPRMDAERVYRFYYHTTYWIDGVSRDINLNQWYRIIDDKLDYHYYARAEGFRPIRQDEIAPISPEVPLEEKRIEVSLSRQLVHCYERERLVFTSRISTGEELSEGDHETEKGDFITFRKRPSRHMSIGRRAGGFDLPGVPWVIYITEKGISFHGTYWHNDFGVPRSHGCINMPTRAAKWLFRWTQPIVPLAEQEVREDYGTRVEIRS